ncbi:lantibiotic dehydratase C-terminal domain-containing protein [Cryptosporangium minutisporangium]|uniref:Thiopeptide-type bacteriocin biosynthesis protein n=1 Tax=Cryptosporangium minutisporangium TaxID=113569 RepID=A0ABP6SRJ0_9ACTN
MTLPAHAPSHPVSVAGDWQAIHIFYAANAQPLLVHCVRPLVRELTEDGLISGYFFINYWLEGPHVRLRLRPVSADATDEVRERSAAAIEAFLRRRPALYEMGGGFLSELYNTLFALEYPGGPPPDLVDADGQMLLRPNNSFSFRPYEPEYDKYGGPAGTALAEWHFQHSSDVVLNSMRSMNLHLRPILFGVSAQLMMVMAGCFLKDRAAVVAFLEKYLQFWHRAFAGTNFIGTGEYERQYGAMAAGVGRRFTHTLDALESGQTERLPMFLQGWAVHCRELSARVQDLASRGELVFGSWDGTGQERLTDPDAVAEKLLSPYLHMTNNRFHVTIRDEAYLAYLLGRSLSEPPARTDESP